ncbi:TrmH family RNA methyltransferase [Actinomyces dentalis]|uniref:TrmH family RNA methyltransferase n=1 Tax=Actinomyces dentalis TaxID=272548 RepID=UPI003CCBB6A3
MSNRRDSTTWRPGVALPRPEGARAPRPDILDNPDSARVARVAGLARRHARDKYERFLVEGPRGVGEAVRHAAAHVHDLYLTPEAADRHADILARARAAGLYTHTVTPRVMAAMSADAQGVLAVVATTALAAGPQPQEDGAGAGEGLAERLAGARLVAVLAEAQDPGNAGTIIRTADAAGADAVVLVRGSVDATNPKVVRSTAGSLFHLPVLTGAGLGEVLEALDGAGLAVLAADGSGPVGLFDADELLARPCAWLFGNEARGLAPEALERAEAVVSVPVLGAAESLNVAAAAAVCLYASVRAQR